MNKFDKNITDRYDYNKINQQNYNNRIKKYDNVMSRVDTNLSLEKKLMILKGKINNKG